MSDVKASHRTALGAARGALAPETVAAASRAIAARVCELRPFIDSPAVLLYSAIAGEVDTENIRAVADRRGIPVYYPRLQPDRKDIDFVRVRPGELLRCGPWNIAEPSGNERFCPGEAALLVVPGLGFDRHGTRLGRGGGHYDRAIRRHRPPVAVVGLAFAVQVVAALPRCEWDEPVDCIVTESEVVECVGVSTRYARVPAGSK
jgi:5-formyltetrahydrofolate cyclo-ligase